MRILGIDPGTNIIGFSFVELNEKKEYKLITAGVIKPLKDDTQEEKLEKIYNELEVLINLYKPTEAAVETLFFMKNVKTAMKVSEARGVILLCLKKNKIKSFDYTPLQIKQSIVGFGRATKAQIQYMTKSIFKLKKYNSR